ncbi:Protein GAT2 [Termitomyces sp. J132]|nr:Protein GAT2 [Termitomyces sp. J132]
MRASAAQGVQALEAVRMGVEAAEREKVLVNGHGQHQHQHQQGQHQVQTHVQTQAQVGGQQVQVQTQTQVAQGVVLQKTEEISPTSPNLSGPVGMGPGQGPGPGAVAAPGMNVSGGTSASASGAGGPGAGAGAAGPGVSLSANGETTQTCLGCRATQTPEWRRGPMVDPSPLPPRHHTGPRTLCNACGLVYAKIIKRRVRDEVGGPMQNGHRGHGKKKMKIGGAGVGVGVRGVGAGEEDSEDSEEEEMLEEEYESGEE